MQGTAHDRPNQVHAGVPLVSQLSEASSDLFKLIFTQWVISTRHPEGVTPTHNTHRIDGSY